MNQEDIVRMAEESGIVSEAYDAGFMNLFTAKLERFAALVAKAERERLASQIDRMPFGDTAASFSIWIREQR